MPMRCQPLRCIFQPLGFVLKCRHHSRLASIASRSFFLSEKLLLRKLSETVVVVGNAPYDRPGFLVGHLVGNRASFLCTKAPLCRVPDELLTISLTSSSNLGGFSASECEAVHTSLLFRPPKVRHRSLPREGKMARQPDSLGFRFALVLALAVIVLALTTWLGPKTMSKWAAYRVSASRLAESNFRYTQGSRQ